MLNHKKQQGISMIEVLVTMIVMAIGLLGMAGLQFTSLKNLNSSNFRYQASILAYDMAERMRANASGVSAGDYSAISVDGTESTVNCTSGCTSSSIASLDSYEWGQGVANLPAGSGSVTANTGVYDIVINWTEQHTGGGFGTSSATPDSKSYTLSVDF